MASTPRASDRSSRYLDGVNVFLVWLLAILFFVASALAGYFQWLKSPDGILGSVTAIAVAYIAWEQFRVNRMRLQVDLYDRRLAVYQDLRDLLQTVLQEGRTDMAQVNRAAGGNAESDFLLGPEVESYLREVHKQGVKLAIACDQLRGVLTPEQRQEQAKVAHDMCAWFLEQFAEAKKVFRPYLRLA